MRREYAALTGICLAAATIAISYLVLFGVPPSSDGAVSQEANQSAESAPEQDASDAHGEDQGDAAELRYDIGGCGSQKENDYAPTRAPAEIAVDVSGGMLVLSHNLTYVCCAEMEVGMEADGDSILLTETNKGGMCRCICDYNIDASVGPLSPGEYAVQLWGVAFEDNEPELLFEKNVSIG